MGFVSSIQKYFVERLIMKKNTSLLITACSTVLLAGCIQVENGEKVGVPTKVGTEGFWCHNTVGSIVRGGLSNGDGGIGTTFDFYVTNSGASKILMTAMDTHQEVKIHYHRDKFLISFCLDRSRYIVDSVEVVKK